MIMRWCIVPVSVAFLFMCIRAIRRSLRKGTSDGLDALRKRAFLASATLTLAGFGLGALIHGSNTLVPAHYHAATGAVTVAFMAYALVTLDGLGVRLSPRMKRIASWQPVLYGAGQLTFALGFGVAGAHGMPRKTYGAEQHIRSLSERIGLVGMGIGGAIAIVGGVLFLGLATAAWRARRHHEAEAQRSVSWTPNIRSIRFRS